MDMKAELLQPRDWSFPVPIAYGPGRLRDLAEICGRAGMRRPLLVTDQGSRDLPFIAEGLDILAKGGRQAGLFAGISPNPRDTDIAAGREAFLGGAHDGIIGIGGGSGMDGAKAIALTAQSGVDLWAFEFERASPPLDGQASFPPLICVPTTAGTGAETESTAMVTDTAQGMKFCVWHPGLKPACALLDPELTLGLPPTITAWTGFDALTHAIEAYTVPDFHPLCDGAALQGLGLVARWLPEAVGTPGSLEARGGMLVGSCLAGVAFLKGLGIVHAVSHMAGAEYGTHHGLLNAIILPAALRFNATAIAEKAGPMAEATGLEGRSVEGLHDAVCGMLDDCDIPRSLAEVGIPADCARRIAQKAMRDSAAGTNARPISTDEMEAFVAEVIEGAR